MRLALGGADRGKGEDGKGKGVTMLLKRRGGRG